MSNNADRIFEQYMNGDWGKPMDKIRLREQTILSEGTPIGYIYEYEDYEYTERIVLLTLQNFKSQRSWKTHRKQLAAAANKAGFPVLFVDKLDMGFGIEYDIAEDTIPNKLLEVARYSQDSDIRTAACATLYYDEEYEQEKYSKIYSYNQLIEGEFVHAEDILCRYIESLGLTRIRTLYSMLEPCYDCLQKIVDLSPQFIKYYKQHKAKWDTYNYIQLSNDIFAGQYTTVVNGKQYKIRYDKLSNKKIDKFYGE